MSSTWDGRQASAASLSVFDSAAAALSKGAERSVGCEPLAGFVPGDRVRIMPPGDAFEADGVPAGTAGTFEGVLRLGAWLRVRRSASTTTARRSSFAWRPWRWTDHSAGPEGFGQERVRRPVLPCAQEVTGQDDAAAHDRLRGVSAA